MANRRIRVKDIYGKPLTRNYYVIRHTEAQQFLTCPRKWMFLSHNGLNLEPVTTNPNLAFGTVWHETLEAYYRAMRSPAQFGQNPANYARSRMEDMIARDITDVQIKFGDRFGMDESMKVTEQAELVRQMFEGYIHWAQNEAYPNDKEFNVIDIERRFIIPIAMPDGKRSAGGYLAVKLDTVVERQGGLWILEHKTAGKSSKVDDVPGLALDLQLSLQALALYYLAQLEYHKPVRGIIYSVSRKQAPSSRVKSPLFGRTIVQKTMEELKMINATLYRIYRDMKQATTLIRKYEKRYPTQPWKVAEAMHYIPQVIGNGMCLWGCPVKGICEGINRREDVTDLIETGLQPRSKSVMEMLTDEMEE